MRKSKSSFSTKKSWNQSKRLKRRKKRKRFRLKKLRKPIKLRRMRKGRLLKKRRKKRVLSKRRKKSEMMFLQALKSTTNRLCKKTITIAQFEISLFSQFGSFQTIVVFLQLRHEIQGVLSWNAVSRKVIILPFDPNLPHLHIGQSFIRKRQVEFVHFGRHRSRFSAICVPANPHHQGIQNHIKVLEIRQVPFLHQRLVRYVDSPGHQKQSDALTGLFGKKKGRYQTSNKPSQKRNIFLLIFLDTSPESTHYSSEQSHETSNEESEADGVLASQYLKQLSWFLQYPFHREEGAQTCFDEIGDQCDLGGVCADGSDTRVLVLAVGSFSWFLWTVFHW